MNVLVLGGQGMAGHMIAAYWRRMTSDLLTVTVRRAAASLAAEGSDGNPLPQGVAVRELDVRDGAAVERVMEEIRPDLVVNATGILNADADRAAYDAYVVNGLLPHWLAHLADRCGARLFQLSTDCVFAGDQGNYRVDDKPSGHSVYARSKIVGEVRRVRHLTIRTSIIGPDARSQGIGLMRWFLSQEGKVPGYRQVFWNGVTTLELAKAVRWYAQRPGIDGIVHLAAPSRVSKYELLVMMQRAFDKSNVEIVPQDEPRLDRTLAPSDDETARYETPGYEQMLAELRDWMEWR